MALNASGSGVARRPTKVVTAFAAEPMRYRAVRRKRIRFHTVRVTSRNRPSLAVFALADLLWFRGGAIAFALGVLIFGGFLFMLAGLGLMLFRGRPGRGVFGRFLDADFAA